MLLRCLTPMSPAVQRVRLIMSPLYACTSGLWAALLCIPAPHLLGWFALYPCNTSIVLGVDMLRVASIAQGGDYGGLLHLAGYRRHSWIRIAQQRVPFPRGLQRTFPGGRPLACCSEECKHPITDEVMTVLHMCRGCVQAMASADKTTANSTVESFVFRPNTWFISNDSLLVVSSLSLYSAVSTLGSLQNVVRSLIQNSVGFRSASPCAYLTLLHIKYHVSLLYNLLRLGSIRCKVDQSTLRCTARQC